MKTKKEALLRLWILRIVVPLEGHRQFITPQGVRHEGIARLLGLTGVEGEAFDECNQRTLLAQLRRCHRAAEQVCQRQALSLPQPLADNLQQLRLQVGLSEVEYWILGFTVLLYAEQRLDEACAWLGLELSSLKVYQVLSVLLGFPEAAIREALSSRSVLSQTALVVLNRYGQDALRRRLEVLSESFADRLVSERGSPVDWLRDRIIPSQPAQLSLTDFSHLQESLDLLLPFLKQVLTTRKTGVNVLLYGPPGTGKTQLTRVLANTLNCVLYEIASGDEEGEPVLGKQRLSAFRAAQAFFQNTATLLLFDEVEDVFNDGDGLFGKKSTAQTRKAWMNRLLEENPVPTFWLGNHIDSIDPAFIRRFDWVLELSIPPKGQRERIIRESCGTLLTQATLQQLASCEQLAPAVVTRAAGVVSTLKGQFPATCLEQALLQWLQNTLRAQGHEGLKTQKFNPLPAFYDTEFLNCDSDLKQLSQGIQQQGSARLCLYGPPGTGKSAYAYWLAEYLDKPLHSQQGAKILSKWVGGTEKNLARIFEVAEQEQAVLLLDEIDGFLAGRNFSQHSWEVTAVNELLTQLETFNGVFIAATNRLEQVDTAALRRFDLKIRFEPLKPNQAWQLLQRCAQVLGIEVTDSDPILNALQKLHDLAPGDFAVLARQHRLRPFKDTQALIAALQAECALKTPFHQRTIGFF